MSEEAYYVLTSTCKKMAGKGKVTSFTFMSWDSDMGTDPVKPWTPQLVRTELEQGFWEGKVEYLINKNRI